MKSVSFAAGLAAIRAAAYSAIKKATTVAPSEVEMRRREIAEWNARVEARRREKKK